MALTGAPAPGRAAPVLLVAAGGTLGTGARALLDEALTGRAGGWPWATFGANVSGALLLGVLVAALAGGGPDVGARRLTRLALGTGVLGGYTTYSAFAVQVVGLAEGGRPGVALGYAAGSVVAGLLAAWVGTRVGGALPATGARRGRARS